MEDSLIINNIPSFGRLGNSLINNCFDCSIQDLDHDDLKVKISQALKKNYLQPLTQDIRSSKQIGRELSIK